MNDKLVLYALIPTVNITIKTCQYFINSLKLRTSKKPVDHEKSIDNATKVTKLSSH